jgi:Notch-like protein
MFVSPVTVQEVEEVIKSLKSNVSAGFDEIPMSIVKRCLRYFIRPLVHIYNKSLQTGIFSDMMEIAKIRHLFKKGDRKVMQNYRPISILTSFTKILEKLMFKTLLSFLKKA